MLVVVSQPHINEFRIEGMVSDSYLESLRKQFGDYVHVEKEDDREWIPLEEVALYQEFKANETPEDNLRFYRKLVKMTQKELARMLGVSKQFVSDMENGRRGISKGTAKELARIFSVPVERFI